MEKYIYHMSRGNSGGKGLITLNNQ